MHWIYYEHGSITDYIYKPIIIPTISNSFIPCFHLLSFQHPNLFLQIKGFLTLTHIYKPLFEFLLHPIHWTLLISNFMQLIFFILDLIRLPLPLLNSFLVPYTIQQPIMISFAYNLLLVFNILLRLLLSLLNHPSNRILTLLAIIIQNINILLFLFLKLLFRLNTIISNQLFKSLYFLLYISLFNCLQ